jgi:hypothetical protein
LWRVGVPVSPTADGTTTASKPEPLAPLTQLGEVLAENSVGRRASLERVIIGEVVSPRAVWLGADDDRIFAVLDPDVKNAEGTAVQPGARVTLIGLVRAVPPEDVAIREWSLDPATAKMLREHGTYLYVTEIRPAA